MWSRYTWSAESTIPNFFCRRAASERNPTSAHHRVSADVVVLIDRNHRGALIARHNRRAQSGRSGPGDHHIGDAIPSRDPLGREVGLLRRDARQRGGADAKRAVLEELSSIHFTVTSTS